MQLYLVQSMYGKNLDIAPNEKQTNKLIDIYKRYFIVLYISYFLTTTYVII